MKLWGLEMRGISIVEGKRDWIYANCYYYTKNLQIIQRKKVKNLLNKGLRHSWRSLLK